ncbi:MAG: sulfotransferase family protein [Gammaproteobacteria bacterium]|nr:sulfotransferase family protein [Gammaproteobacteria bacterium]
MMPGIPDFTGWIPIRFYWHASEPWVEWCYLGDRRFTEPFFDETVQRALEHPFNLAFRRQTPLNRLVDLADSGTPPLIPTGFIFHMSRCGSTLAAQMLASLPDTIVVSEASLLESLLRTDSGYSINDNAGRAEGLRSLVRLLGRMGTAGRTRFFIKFDSWHTVHLPLIQQVFPDVPWIFLYRDPVEVLVSLSRSGGRRLVPGVVDPALLGLEAAEAFQLPAPEYNARILACICDTALARHRRGKSLFLDYKSLPDAVWTALPDHFDFTIDEVGENDMRARAVFGGKGGDKPFRKDSDAKHQAAGAAIREAARRWVEPLYHRMEAMRTGTG